MAGMGTWSEGETEFDCTKCGATHIVSWKNYPDRDQGVVVCEVEGCGGVVKKWEGTRDYGAARLKAKPE